MAYHALSENFKAFFANLNPSLAFEQTASSQYNTIKGLIEDRRGPAAALSPVCFLQGSYKQETAIYNINDVDIVALCWLQQPGSGSGTGWFRDQIFATVASPLLSDGRYSRKVQYNAGSMCIKVDLGIKVEILPAVYKAGTNDPAQEPFRLFRPETRQWEDGYARYHQGWLSWKNQEGSCNGNFIPAVKVFKRLRSIFGLNAVSFHIECLLFALRNDLFSGPPTDYIKNVLGFIASVDAGTWFTESKLRTPCGDRAVFVNSEWAWASWQAFHNAVVNWAQIARQASGATGRDTATQNWQALLGSQHFPRDAR